MCIRIRTNTCILFSVLAWGLLHIYYGKLMFVFAILIFYCKCAKLSHCTAMYATRCVTTNTILFRAMLVSWHCVSGSVCTKDLWSLSELFSSWMNLCSIMTSSRKRGNRCLEWKFQISHPEIVDPYFGSDLQRFDSYILENWSKLLDDSPESPGVLNTWLSRLVCIFMCSSVCVCVYKIPICFPTQIVACVYLHFSQFPDVVLAYNSFL